VSRGQVQDGLLTLERLVQRNPQHPLALEMARQLR